MLNILLKCWPHGTVKGVYYCNLEVVDLSHATIGH